MKNSKNYRSNPKQRTSIGSSSNTRFNKKRHKKNGKKPYRGQGK